MSKELTAYEKVPSHTLFHGDIRDNIPMKTTLILTLFFISSLVFANNCDSLDMTQEREKTENLNHLPQEYKDRLLSLKRKVKQAQVYHCVDNILSGKPVGLNSEERDIALTYLRMLESVSKDGDEKELIKFAKEEIEKV